ncbi:MAG TPA: type IV toxin-antitoxin system AbiEi family antitoxin domain-containing protein [Solirubrobacterales bacterium]|nr:type IV toxin-antitoxin system AbiEi family antitoxin domain-containing protein [Solirubrobacterales bacterium]
MSSLTEVDQRRRRAERERQVLAFAEQQHGVISLDQLRSLGLTAEAVRARVAVGRLHRVRRAVYAVGRPDLPLDGRWMAAVLACGSGAVLSHRSAAALHGLLADVRAVIDVTLGRRSGRSVSGIRLHRLTCLPSVDCVSVRSIPCTSVPRTLLDLAGVVEPRLLERACDQADVLGLLDVVAVREAMARNPRRPGVRRLRWVLELGDLGENLPRSELEERFVSLCHNAGMPRPSVNEWITVSSEPMQVDFMWRDRRAIVETDGYRAHRTRQAFRRDRRRDRLLRLEGWQVARFTWEDVTGDPRHVTQVLRKLLAP